MEKWWKNHDLWWFTCFNWWFRITMWNYQRVTIQNGIEWVCLWIWTNHILVGIFWGKYLPWYLPMKSLWIRLGKMVGIGWISWGYHQLGLWSPAALGRYGNAWIPWVRQVLAKGSKKVAAQGWTRGNGLLELPMCGDKTCAFRKLIGLVPIG